MHLKNDRKGFTLTEVMISLTIILVILSLTFPLLTVFKSKSYYHEMSAHQLFTFLQEEINGSRSFQIQSNKLIVFDSSNRTVILEQYGTIVKRSVDGQGHEALLQEVQSFQIEAETHSILVKVVMKNEETYKRNIHLSAEE